MTDDTNFDPDTLDDLSEVPWNGLRPQLGDLAVDVVTRFRGVVVSRSEHIGGGVELALERTGRAANSLANESIRRFAGNRVRVITPGFGLGSGSEE